MGEAAGIADQTERPYVVRPPELKRDLNDARATT